MRQRNRLQMQWQLRGQEALDDEKVGEKGE
jgi:hypothetical protein